jgi:hypothetical protein
MDKDFSDLEAVLRAAGGGYKGSGDNKRAVWADHLSGLVDYLGAQGVTPEDLAPLNDLQDALRGDEFGADEFDGGWQDDDEFLEARTGNAAPSDAILARASALIDLLVLEGKSEEVAAQAVTRKLLLAGVNPPSEGGDARGYMRLVEWRQKLRQERVSAAALMEYHRFRATIENIPLRERLNRVLTERLWDRRAAP